MTIQPNQIPLPQLETKIRELAAAQPDRTSERHYVLLATDADTGKPVTPVPECIFGHAFTELGVDPFTLHPSSGRVQALLVREGYIHQNADTAHWCNRVQAAQDDGKTWSEAVLHADAMWASGL